MSKIIRGILKVVGIIILGFLAFAGALAVALICRLVYVVLNPDCLKGVVYHED